MDWIDGRPRGTFGRLLAGTLTGLLVIAAGQVNGDLRTDAVKELARRRLDDAGIKSPFHCHDAWLAEGTGFILDLEPWAEAAGLQRGDRIISLGGVSAANEGGWTRALEGVQHREFLALRVQRSDRTIDIRLVCKRNNELSVLQKSMYEAMASGDWDQCFARAGEAMQKVKRPYSIFLRAQVQCWDEKLRAAGSDKPRDFWQRLLGKTSRSDRPRAYWELVYRLDTRLIEEARFRPTRIADIRSEVLFTIDRLKEAGWTTHADDLAQQLRCATRK